MDWLKTMKQTFEFYTVDPNTWRDKDRITTIVNCTINRESSANTLGSATFDIIDSLGETYVRVYLIANQNDVTEKLPLGTFLAQTPSSSFNGRTRSVTMDAYTPLLELSEKLPPIGYTTPKDSNILEMAYKLTREGCRAPVVKTTNDKTLHYDFVANVDDTWVSYINDLLSNANYSYSIDEMGRILFEPKQTIDSLQPIWTYTDDNSSILYPEISTDHDIYGIPNVVEVVYSNGSEYLFSRVQNDDSNSPLSIQSRGREIVHRDSNPSIIGNPTQDEIDLYAKKLLKELSSVEFTLSYKHGYCPVRVGDCVRLNYKRAGLTDIKARVISQSISCIPGAPVSEKAIFTAKLWR